MGDSKRQGLRAVLAAGMLAAGLACAAAAASAQTIVDEWAGIKAPPAPALQTVTVDPHTTALLVLDLVKQVCNPTYRPRCLATLPKVAALLKKARTHKVLVVYSLVMANRSIAEVLPPVAALGTEPVVKSGPDKFLNTDLAQVLKAHGISTIIPVGSAADGAVMYTASHAALLGYRVLLPVDGMSSHLAYTEQYVTWNMSHAPVVSLHVTLTSIDRLHF
ncbi:MAG TPA: isochorismatase family protein [Acetobacteraceae bacterium]|nr:isochorismatase family protein [Acetobacteraceae bacterium]